MNKLERFLHKVIKSESGCWEWNSTYRTDNGYPMFYWGKPSGKEVFKKAHRAAWLLFKGEIPYGLHVCHTCDNRGCVNPEHLWLGTHQDNMDDRNTKGRTSAGSHRYNFKRNNDLIKNIKQLRNEGVYINDLCKQLNIGRTTYFRVMKSLERSA